YNLLYTSSLVGMLMSPQSMVLEVTASLTINLSFGDRPVNFPVFTHNAPLSLRLPWPYVRVCCVSVALSRFQWMCSARIPSSLRFTFESSAPISRLIMVLLYFVYGDNV